MTKLKFPLASQIAHVSYSSAISSHFHGTHVSVLALAFSSNLPCACKEVSRNDNTAREAPIMWPDTAFILEI